MKFREGDFLETLEGFIFDVKGLSHPPNKVIAYLRYVPDSSGSRMRLGVKYRKIYRLKDREDFLREKAPIYIFRSPVFNMEVQGVPLNRIKCIYNPQLKIKQLIELGVKDTVEREALEFVKLLSVKSRVPVEDMGLSGSLLVDLHNENSDIDLIVYGRENSLKVYRALGELMNEHDEVKPYNTDELAELYEFRSQDTSIPFKAFLKVEGGKKTQGKFMGRSFFIRFLHDWGEVSEKYGDKIYEPIGFCTIKAEVSDDSESIFTPCRYMVSNVQFLSGVKANPAQVKEVYSFRGRFCEQAKTGDTIRASGKLEKVTSLNGESWFRVVVGGDRGDYMIPEDLLTNL
ncbi:nucleotidyltransferase domain-containing protein [Candidatus Bathyarchaeota archaeon]|nr:nucleotidyltransferase domain-containing protein [Candidatus Bathyarchaeota archaeon]MBS7613827.1 nucleotidyltransferase domain-containing protein [Candidatus Bathyarchaeota archaeon]MBS7617441.1 nucleotidyltransferase domain-containing protein [Candidatus Bathyarchaeota archaeon]